MRKNRLHLGDNLEVLRKHVADESVDLIYLDPPFNSNRNYSAIFAKDGAVPDDKTQVHAFEDTWRWTPETAALYERFTRDERSPADAVHALSAFTTLLGQGDATAYLTNMAPRLVELHRVLKPTGSLFLHCDPTMSHYLKVLLDSIFGAALFRNEIVWKRANTVKGNFGQGQRALGTNTDTILFYAKGKNATYHQVFTEYDEHYLDTAYRHVEEGTGRRYRLISMIGPGGAAKGNPSYEVMGVTRYWRYARERMRELIAAGMVVQTKPGAVPQRKQYLDEGRGVAVQSNWTDIPNLQAANKETLGYPTQKPLALLERVLRIASDEGDVMLDPFCGCGTSLAAAQRLNRSWIGVDVAPVAIDLTTKRLRTAHGEAVLDTFEVLGAPGEP